MFERKVERLPCQRRCVKSLLHFDQPLAQLVSEFGFGACHAEVCDFHAQPSLAAHFNLLVIARVEFVKPREQHGERRIPLHLEIFRRQQQRGIRPQPRANLIGARAVCAITRGFNREVAFEKTRQHPFERERHG